MGRVVVLETDETLRSETRVRLLQEGHEVLECSTREGLAELLKSGADAALLGSTQPPLEASTLTELRALDPATPFIVVAASPEQALAALVVGAFYVARHPVGIEELVLLIARALDATADERRERVRLTAAPGSMPEPELIGETAAMRGIKDSIRRLRGSSRSAVLIKGESGSGKDIIARAIHFASTSEGPFVYVTPFGISSQQLEVELFGSERSSLLPYGRAGLIERAEGGTLYLDEIADMPLTVQTRLLPLLQDGTFRRMGASSDRLSNVRVIASSARNLQAAVHEGTLRSELLYRLAVLTLDVPPLRDRATDIPLLVRHLLKLIASRIGRPLLGVSDSTIELLAKYSWPGNVRELANALEHAALSSEVDLIEPHQLRLSPPSQARIEYCLPSCGIDFGELERQVVIQALGHARGNQTRAAVLLGMTRDQIRYRLMKFGLGSRGEDTRLNGIQVA
jgi:DNA-binding NtrC family response regulator